LVTKASPFHWIVDAVTKSLPVAVSVKAGLPEATFVGDSAVMAGIGFGGTGFGGADGEEPPPQAHKSTSASELEAEKRNEMEIKDTGRSPLKVVAPFSQIYLMFLSPVRIRGLLSACTSYRRLIIAHWKPITPGG
jgi:hypothetical protein